MKVDLERMLAREDRLCSCRLPQEHAELDRLVGSASGRLFVSDWSGRHPFQKRYVRDVPSVREEDLGHYAHLSWDGELRSAIAAFHRQVDGLNVEAKHVVPGDGASTFLAAFALWLRRTGRRRVLYIPPLYYTFHDALSTAGIEHQPVTDSPLLTDRDIRLDLPEQESVLLLTDPIWFAGRRVPGRAIGQLAAWQQRTRSTIFVDGSFQYMRWTGVAAEQTAGLDPDLTFRLVCPTKSLGIHAYRFSYVLAPVAWRDSFAATYDSMIGASSQTTRVFAIHAMGLMSDLPRNHEFLGYLGEQFSRLQTLGIVTCQIDSDCTYFVFGRLSIPRDQFLGMDGKYFELAGYDGYYRVNLCLSDQIIALRR